MLTFDPPALTIPAGGGSGSIKVLSNTADYPWTAAASSAWISVSGGGYGSGSFTYTVLENIAAITRTTDLQVNNFRLTVTQAAGPGIPPPVRLGLRFVPINPCRLVDTRENLGEFGKPSLTGGAARAFRLPLGRCNIGSAAAYSLNITVVPKGFLGYVTIWPTGAVQPLVSTLNSVDGRVKANAAIVPSGVEGAVSVYATNDTDIVIDINGYFVESDGLAFYPIPPCRAVDTRNPNGQLGGPAIAAAGIRNFPLALSNCNIPNNVRAYSLNATVVPSGPLGYLTLWPTGLDAPLVSTLNAPLGGVVANAAIVVAGGSGLGSISAYASGQTHLVVDINGYFAPVGSPNELRFYPIVPCRLVDTRNPPGLLGGFILPAGERRSFPLVAGGCTILETVRAYSLNATVVPDKALGYLTLWPAAQAQPLVSTLNALDDPIVANAAIVPAGQLGAISAFVTDRTHLILDTNGYFAP